jgi:DNA end-binding protein Ku
MEITQFVDEADLPPEFFEKPYFVVPENEAQTEAFLTVRKALVDTRKLALTKVAFAGREHIVAIAPAGSDEHGGMMAYTMRYAAELRDPADYFRDVKKVAIAEDSLELAKQLIKKRAAKFDPSKFIDGYEVAVKELVDAKLKHAPIPQDEAPAPQRGKVINLMDALRKSVSGADKPARETEAATKPEPRKGPTLVKTSPKHAGKSTTKHAAKTSPVAAPRRKTA